LFPDELFSDLFAAIGRRSVVATVMVRQRLEGLSDREAVDRFTFDVRRRYAAGGGWDGAGPVGFAAVGSDAAPGTLSSTVHLFPIRHRRDHDADTPLDRPAVAQRPTRR
jgi:hypothetical protein